MRMKKFCLFIFAILLIGIASAVCCERTLTGAWCQNVDDEAQCNVGVNPFSIDGHPYRSVSAFCEATSYCRPGTCVNNRDGICMPNTAKIVCDQNHGSWIDKPMSEIAQCKQGCCLMGESAAFTTQIACNRMSSLYGLTVSYRADLSSESECLANANPSAKGACVYTKDLVKTCEMMTKKECGDKKRSSSVYGVEFHEGLLCSAPKLETICDSSCVDSGFGITCQTKCNGDDVYFVDTCGNFANVYNANMVDAATSENYWTYIAGAIEEVQVDVGDGEGNANSAVFGDCDYYSGTMCKEKKVGDILHGGQLYGNYFCKDLDCRDYDGSYSGENTYPHHGESWCATDSGGGYESGGEMQEGYDVAGNNPGDTHYRLICYNGEVTTEICDTTRQKICAETNLDSTGGSFMVGNCKTNLWQSCTAQTSRENCEGVAAQQLRDCRWISSDYEFSKKGLITTGDVNGVCVPKYAPGFERDGNNKVNGGEICSLANSFCDVKMERGMVFGKEVTCNPNDPFSKNNNCSCLDEYDGEEGYVWRDTLAGICVQLGDCGGKVNYLDRNGDERDDVIDVSEGEF